MRTNSYQRAHMPPLAGAAVRLARRVADVIAECNEAQRRLTALRLAPDSYAIGPEHAPDSYAEFLFRTSGWLRHEPPARDRAAC